MRLYKFCRLLCFQLSADVSRSVQLTWVDLAFLIFAGWGKTSGNEALLDKYPKLKALEKRVESVPRVAAWIAKRPVTEM